MKMQKSVLRRQIQIRVPGSLILQFLLGVGIGLIPLLIGLFFILDNGSFGRSGYIGANAATCLLGLMLYIGDFLCASTLLRRRTLRYAGIAIIIMLVITPIFLLFFSAIIHNPTIIQ